MIPRAYVTHGAAALAEPLAGSGEDGALSPEHQAAVARFDGWLVATHKAADTRRLYVGAVRRWFAAGGAPGHLDRSLLLRFLAVRRQRCSNSTVNLDIKGLRAFYAAQAVLGHCDPIERAKLPRLARTPKRLPRFLTPDQVGEVLGSLPLNTFTGLRDYAMIRLLFETGLRSSELAALQLGSVLDDCMIFVERGKGGRDRYVPISREMFGVLEGYVAARGRLRPGKKAALWLTHQGKPLRNRRTVWEIVSRRVWAALRTRQGFVKMTRVGRSWQGHYPHELRASFATALLAGGCPLTAIAQMMGHADVATTALYLGVDLAMLQRATALHPRAKRHEEALPNA